MPPERQVSPERKTVYYIGTAVFVIGVLTFLSTFLSGALHFGDFTDFEARGRSMALRAVLGFAMIVGGSLLQRTGKFGIAGSGVKLDPEEARKDVEPWARMSGGVAKDALDEAGIQLGRQASDENLPFDERLRRLQQLHKDGLVNDAEFEATKKKILDKA